MVPPSESKTRLPVPVLVSIVLSLVIAICMLPNVPPVETIEPLVTISPARTISEWKVATPATPVSYTHLTLPTTHCV